MRVLILMYLLFIGHISKAQDKINEIADYTDSLMNYGVAYPMIPGGVLSIVTSDSIILNKGYGFSNYEAKIPVSIDNTLFQLGSLGKAFTSIAAIQQALKGKIYFDENINNYLDDWKIKNPYDQPITLKHLLTHTAGFDDRVIGYMAKSNRDLEPLEIHLKKNMPELFQEPGKSINYSNYSFALTGHLVEITSGKSFNDYVRDYIFGPLDMNNSSFFLPDNYRELSKYALGYRWRDTFEEVKAYPRHATPAGSIISTASDMAVFLQALLRKDSTLLPEKGYELMFNQQFTNHPKLTGYTLGLEVQNFNGETAVGKGGNVPGFLSFFLLFQDLDLGIFISLNTQTDNFLEIFMNKFIDRFFPVNGDPRNSPISVDTKEYAGVYQNQRANHHTIEEMFALFEGQFRLRKLENGNLGAFHNGENHEYAPIESDIFQNIKYPGQYLVFKRDQGNVKELYRNFILGGIQVPASYEKLSWFERPRFLNDEYPYALMVIVSYLLLPAFWWGVFFIRKRRPDFLRSTRVPVYYHAVAFVFLILFLWNIIGFFIPLLSNRQELFFGFPQELLFMKYFNYLMAFNAIVLIGLSIMMWLKHHGNIWVRVYYTIYSLVALSYILVLHRWHFLNITYH